MQPIHPSAFCECTAILPVIVLLYCLYAQAVVLATGGFAANRDKLQVRTWLMVNYIVFIHLIQFNCIHVVYPSWQACLIAAGDSK